MREKTRGDGRFVLSLSVLFFSALLVASCSPREKQGLVACWKFDEGAGDKLLDTSGNGNHGGIHGATWIEGRIGGGLRFDGVDDYVKVPKSASLNSITKEITLMCWIKTPLTGRYSILERWPCDDSNQRCLELDVDFDGKCVNFALSPHGALGAWHKRPESIRADKWVHIVATSDGQTMRVYVNGEPDSSASAPEAPMIHPSTADLHIGAWQLSIDKWESFFKGSMDEIKIYSRTLTHEEILNDYKARSPKGMAVGRIVDVNGNPIEAAKVSVGPFLTTTDRQGRYKIAVPARPYDVKVAGRGYKRGARSDVNVKEDETAEANIVLIEDKTLPVVSELKVEYVDSVNVIIHWETDEVCTGIVKYGTSSRRYNKTIKDTSYAKSHKLTLTKLAPGTKYYFAIESRDGAENAAISKERTFTTKKVSHVGNSRLIVRNPVMRYDSDSSFSLDGEWNFATDPKNVGETEKWYLPENRLPAMPLPGYASHAKGKIKVPGIWDAQGYGTETKKVRHNFVGKGWYKRRVNIPRRWDGRRIFLHITGVHRYAKVWIDRQFLGEHVGYLSAFEFEITRQVRFDRAVTITIQVDSKQCWDVDALFGASDLADYMGVAWGGIWGHVMLDARPDTWLEDLFIQPRVSPTRCTAIATIRGKSQKATAARLDVFDSSGRLVAQKSVALSKPLVDGADVEVSVGVPNANLWSPETPTLYVARLSMSDEKGVIDRLESRFGFREIEIRGTYIYLNGKRLFLRGYGDDHIYPKQMAMPTDKSVHLNRLRLIKAYGFNHVRHHSTVMPPEYYDACDELGILAQVEFPIVYKNTYERAERSEVARQTYKREWAAVIKRHRNHPSVLHWCMGNELYKGVPMRHDFAKIVRRLDPSRPFFDSDGLGEYFLAGRDRDTLDLFLVQFDVQRIPLDSPRKFNFFKKPIKPVISHETGNYVTFPRLDQIESFKHNIKPFWMTEGRDKIKCLGLLKETNRWAENSERLYLLCHKLNIEALRKNPYISGYHWWLFQDYWTTSNGIVDFHFRPKSIRTDEVRRFNSDVVLLVDGLDLTYRGKSPLKLAMMVSNWSPQALTRAVLTWRVKIDGRLIAREELNPGKVGQGEVASVGKIELALPDVTGPSRIVIEAELATPTRRYHNDWTAWLYPSQIKPGRPGVPIFADKDLMKLLGPLGAKPVPKAESLDPRAVYAISNLNPRLVKAAERGASLMLLECEGLLPSIQACFKPSWWKSGGRDRNINDCGTVVYDHPVTKAMAPEGWCDAGWYHLLEGARKYVLEGLPSRPDVIIRGIPLLHKARDMAFVFEARVGDGSIIVSGLNHAAAKDRPEGRWLLARMVEHAASLPQPRAKLPVSFLRSQIGK